MGTLVQRFRKEVWISLQGSLSLFFRAAVLLLAFRSLGFWDKAPLQARLGANFLAAWVSKPFDFVVWSGFAVYPLKNRIDEPQSSER
jgi:hypothetical protein